MNSISISVPATGIIVVIKNEERLVAVDLGFGLVDAFTKEGRIHLVDEAHLHIHRKL